METHASRPASAWPSEHGWLANRQQVHESSGAWSSGSQSLRSSISYRSVERSQHESAGQERRLLQQRLQSVEGRPPSKKQRLARVLTFRTPSGSAQHEVS